ncbi:hypothetical protein JHK82_053167 [Glycine max]|nr:hypothetical protein JHK85_053881 [Glycine max]KAG5085770.1 hypothetical protein JHK82_053167 [Glycine max]
MDFEAEKEHEAATLYLSLSIIFPFVQPKNIPSTTLQPSKLKVPTQASSFTHLSLSTITPPPSKTSFKSTISANPLHAPLSLAPYCPRDPSNAVCLTVANNDSLSVLPIFCFDKIGPYRAAFLIDSISDLRRNLQARGFDLVVRVRKLETVLAKLAKALYPKCCKRKKREKLLEMIKVRENVFLFTKEFQILSFFERI